MAKLKGPLFSFGASGAIGKTLVYFPWKGIDCVREYVIPANPQSGPQTTQRGFLTAAVAAIHAAFVAAATPMGEPDKSAYALAGSVFATPRTWFNQAVKNWLDCYRAGDEGAIFRSGYATPAAETLHVHVYSVKIDAAKITSGRFFYGRTKTALLSSTDATIVSGNEEAHVNIVGLTNGIKYFWQFRVDDTETCQGAKSGIYYATPAA